MVYGYIFVHAEYVLDDIVVGCQWSVELACLQNSGSSFEAVQALRRMEELLVEVDLTDRLRFCKTDFVQSVQYLQSNPKIWHNDIVKEVIHICRSYFDHSSFSKLPHCVMMSIMLWLPIKEYSTVSCVCQEWQFMSSSCGIWRDLYYYKFLRNNTLHQANPTPLPIAAAEGSYKNAFRSRLFDPHIGDKVEVAWCGKFRLEGADVYQGSAWWVAEVVDKHSAVGKYKIRYPGWDRRWDEWVPKDKLRWAVECNTVATLRVNDLVEIWCCGASVPGAWLESKITEVKKGKFCVGEVVSTGSLWVERSRLRPASRRVDRVKGRSPRNDALSSVDRVLAGDLATAAIENSSPDGEGDHEHTSPRRARSARNLWDQLRHSVRRRGNLRRTLSLPFPSFGRTRSHSQSSSGGGSRQSFTAVHDLHITQNTRAVDDSDNMDHEEVEHQVEDEAADAADAGHDQMNFGAGEGSTANVYHMFDEFADYPVVTNRYAARHNRNNSNCTIM
jgi:hypothetical protein